MIDYIVIYLITVNIIASLLSAIDKYKAQRGLWRISEVTLLSFAVVGGAFGEYITMKVIRHKTKHKKFMYGLPAIMFFHIIVTAILLLKTAQII